jgi:hypothetical protein
MILLHPLQTVRFVDVEEEGAVVIAVEGVVVLSIDIVPPAKRSFFLFPIFTSPRSSIVIVTLTRKSIRVGEVMRVVLN